MKRLATLVLITGLLAGCNVPIFTTGGKPSLPGVNQPVEALAGVTFKPISATNARLLNSGGNVVAAGGGNAIATGAMAAPAAAPAMAEGAAMDAAVAKSAPAGRTVPNGGAGNGGATSSAGGAYSGNVWSYYGYYGYFGPYGNDSTDPMALVSITEAETAGGKGTFQDVIKGVAAPVVKAWANDARLIQSGATLNGDGQVFIDPDQPARKPGIDMVGGGYYGDTPGWRLTYVSPNRKELLNFYVTPQKTLIIRMRWAPLTLAPELVTIDSASAIKKLVAAIEDKNGKGEEEKSGLDYFLGTPFDQPKTPETNEWNRTEVVYDVPDKARWNVKLESVLGKLVWSVSYNTYDYPVVGPVYAAGTAVTIAAPAADVKAAFQVQQVAVGAPAVAPMPMPKPGFSAPPPKPNGEWREGYFNNSGSGMVDAQTGAVIRFTRPTKTYYRDYSYTPPPVVIEPSMPPEVKESPTPTPSPSADVKASPLPETKVQ